MVLSDYLGRWNQWLGLVSCRRKEILAQGPTPDPKTKLIVLLFLTLPHPVDCLSCVKDIMIIKFGDVVHLDEATGSRYHFFLFCFVLFFCLYFFAVFICSFMTGT